MPEPTHPMQPVVTDKHGVHRFKRNVVVRYLLDHGGLTVGDLAIQQLPVDDQRQFEQLIGYSVSGYRDLRDGEDPEDPAEHAARPGNSDGECITQALALIAGAWAVDTPGDAADALNRISQLLSASPSGCRHAPESATTEDHAVNSTLLDPPTTVRMSDSELAERIAKAPQSSPLTQHLTGALFDERAALTQVAKERDEARREICEDRGIRYGNGAENVALDLGWAYLYPALVRQLAEQDRLRASYSKDPGSAP